MKTDRITAALGECDEDVMNMQAGIAGLVFENWSDAEIAAGAIEMAQNARRQLEDEFKAAREGSNDASA